MLDVPGAGLGHATIVRDDDDPPAGNGIARTGVTVVNPGGDVWASPVPAGVAILNGAGELTGSLQIREWGVVETPIFLTSTMQVGRVYDAACRLLMAEQPGIADSVVIPVVGECDDSWLNDPRTMHVTDADVAQALAQAPASNRRSQRVERLCGCWYRHGVHGLEGRDRYVLARAAGWHHSRRRVADELRRTRTI
ncbi:MAG: P1 family peptidase [Candidatus Nanopelagicales bacterium]